MAGVESYGTRTTLRFNSTSLRPFIHPMVYAELFYQMRHAPLEAELVEPGKREAAFAVPLSPVDGDRRLWDRFLVLPGRFRHSVREGVNAGLLSVADVMLADRNRTRARARVQAIAKSEQAVPDWEHDPLLPLREDGPLDRDAIAVLKAGRGGAHPVQLTLLDRDVEQARAQRYAVFCMPFSLTDAGAFVAVYILDTGKGETRPAVGRLADTYVDKAASRGTRRREKQLPGAVRACYVLKVWDDHQPGRPYTAHVQGLDRAAVVQLQGLAATDFFFPRAGEGAAASLVKPAAPISAARRRGPRTPVATLKPRPAADPSPAAAAGATKSRRTARPRNWVTGRGDIPTTAVPVRNVARLALLPEERPPGLVLWRWEHADSTPDAGVLPVEDAVKTTQAVVRVGMEASVRTVALQEEAGQPLHFVAAVGAAETAWYFVLRDGRWAELRDGGGLAWGEGPPPKPPALFKESLTAVALNKDVPDNVSLETFLLRTKKPLYTFAPSGLVMRMRAYPRKHNEKESMDEGTVSFWDPRVATDTSRSYLVRTPSVAGDTVTREMMYGSPTENEGDVLERVLRYFDFDAQLARLPASAHAPEGALATLRREGPTADLMFLATAHERQPLILAVAHSGAVVAQHTGGGATEWDGPPSLSLREALHVSDEDLSAAPDSLEGVGSRNGGRVYGPSDKWDLVDWVARTRDGTARKSGGVPERKRAAATPDWGSFAENGRWVAEPRAGHTALLMASAVDPRAPDALRQIAVGRGPESKAVVRVAFEDEHREARVTHSLLRRDTLLLLHRAKARSPMTLLLGLRYNADARPPAYEVLELGQRPVAISELIGEALARMPEGRDEFGFAPPIGSEPDEHIGRGSPSLQRVVSKNAPGSAAARDGSLDASSLWAGEALKGAVAGLPNTLSNASGLRNVREALEQDSLGRRMPTGAPLEARMRSFIEGTPSHGKELQTLMYEGVPVYGWRPPVKKDATPTAAALVVEVAYRNGCVAVGAPDFLRVPLSDGYPVQVRQATRSVAVVLDNVGAVSAAEAKMAALGLVAAKFQRLCAPYSNAAAMSPGLRDQTLPQWLWETVTAARGLFCVGSDGMARGWLSGIAEWPATQLSDDAALVSLARAHQTALEGTRVFSWAPHGLRGRAYWGGWPDFARAVRGGRAEDGRLQGPHNAVRVELRDSASLFAQEGEYAGDLPREDCLGAIAADWFGRRPLDRAKHRFAGANKPDKMLLIEGLQVATRRHFPPDDDPSRAILGRPNETSDNREKVQRDSLEEMARWHPVGAARDLQELFPVAAQERPLRAKKPRPESGSVGGVPEAKRARPGAPPAA